MGEGLSLNIDGYKIFALLEQTEDLVKSGQLSKETAMSLIGNLVDIDSDESDNELEVAIYVWMQNLFLHY